MMHLVYLKLEMKRALKRLPNLYAGAIVLLFLMGTIALLSVKTLYGDARTGRISVGVVLPQEDRVAAQVMSMLESLDSVGSICDFHYMTGEEGMEALQKGTVYAVIEVPEGFVADIINGTNTPIKLIFPRNAGIEAVVFGELADAGARTLAASQAGIYAGGELLSIHQRPTSLPQLEAELNQIYLSYSLPREDYFRHYQVRATGDVDTLHFYGISASVLLLLFIPIPVCGYLNPPNPVMRRKLNMAGIGPAMRAGARILGLTLLLALVMIPAVLAAMKLGWLPVWSLTFPILVFVCMAAASFVVCLYQLTANPLSGIMLLFLAGTGQHFMAGGFLPSVFLPALFRQLSPVLPSAILIDGMQMMVSQSFNPAAAIRLLGLLAAGFFISLAGEVRQSCE
ncbi:MAG: ABC transporter permease [Lachnospiraceae bacterium]